MSFVTTIRSLLSRPAPTCRSRHLAALLAVPLVLAQSPVDASDIDTLFNRLFAQFRAGAPDSASVHNHLAAQQSDGTWPDVDYTSRAISTWPTMQHLYRMVALARAYRATGHAFFNAPAVRSSFLRAFDGWIARRPCSDNWWWNDIGAGQTLAPAMLLMREHLSAKQLYEGDTILYRSWRKLGPASTGQNMVWLCKITMWRGAIMDSIAIITPAVQKITETITTTLVEGIQADWSFRQHGAQLYSGGYGTSFSTDCASIGLLLRGTGFAFSNEKVAALSGHILDGQQWMMRGPVMDHSAQGRGLTRPVNTQAPGIFATICRDMQQFNSPRRTEFGSFAARLEGWPATAANSLTGNRAFWRCDYMAHQRPGFFASIKASSKRTRGAEMINNEGLKSYYCGDGVTLIYRTGNEYAGIFPLWDWTRLPGVTCRNDTIPPALSGYQTGTTDFVGGVSDGRYGALHLDYQRDGVSAKKSWFLFDREIVACAAGISAAPGRPVFTSVNQCLTRGVVTCGRENELALLPAGQSRTGDLDWAVNDSVGYLILSGAGQVTVASRIQRGTWKSLNDSQSGATCSDTVFSVWFDHGTAPDRASCAHVIVPGIDAEGMREYVRNPDAIRVLANTRPLQAVYDPRSETTGIVFILAGACALPDSTIVTANLPCAMIVRKFPDSLRITVASPRQDIGPVAITVNRQLTGTGIVWDSTTQLSRIVLDLPTGLRAGASVGRKWAYAGSSVNTRRAGTGPLATLSIRQSRQHLNFECDPRQTPAAGPVQIRLHDLRGALIGTTQVDGTMRGTIAFTGPPAGGLLIVHLRAGTTSVTQRILTGCGQTILVPLAIRQPDQSRHHD